MDRVFHMKHTTSLVELLSGGLAGLVWLVMSRQGRVALARVEPAALDVRLCIDTLVWVPNQAQRSVRNPCHSGERGIPAGLRDHVPRIPPISNRGVKWAGLAGNLGDLCLCGENNPEKGAYATGIFGSVNDV